MQSLSDIVEFRGQYGWLSNFFPCRVSFDGYYYPSVENAYHAAKTYPEQRYKFQICSARTAKKWGKTIFKRAGWDTERLMVMEHLVRQKFSDPHFGELLLSTKDVQLIEGNTWNDTFWGVCDGIGENHLGKILMKIRGEMYV